MTVRSPWIIGSSGAIMPALSHPRAGPLGSLCTADGCAMDRATWRRYQEMMIRARFAAAFLFLLALAAQARVPQWTLVALGTLGGDFNIASAVGNDGALAGYSIAPNPRAAPGQP